MANRTARCCCGDFSITVSGEPHYVHRCHCDYCQRRTGSVFQVSCWFSPEQIVSRTGAYRVYETSPNLESTNAQSDSVSIEAPAIQYKFCTRCGSTVYWDIPMAPGVFGPEATVATAIAVGSFYDARFPAPVEDHYVVDRHHWIPPIEGAVAYEKLPPPQSTLTGEALESQRG